MTTCANLSVKKKGWPQRVFHERVKKIIKNVAEKSFSVFEFAIFGTFEHTKTFFGEIFNNLFYTFMKNQTRPPQFFFKDKFAHVVK